MAALAALLCLAATDSPPLAGMWGAGDALLAMDAQGGRLQTGCTLIRFDPVHVAADGRFSTPAQVETINLAPPVADGEDDAALPEPKGQAATLTGRVTGGGIDLSLAIGGQAPRALHLMAGQRGKPARCL